MGGFRAHHEPDSWRGSHQVARPHLPVAASDSPRIVAPSALPTFCILLRKEGVFKCRLSRSRRAAGFQTFSRSRCPASSVRCHPAVQGQGALGLELRGMVALGLSHGLLQAPLRQRYRPAPFLSDLAFPASGAARWQQRLRGRDFDRICANLGKPPQGIPLPLRQPPRKARNFS